MKTMVNFCKGCDYDHLIMNVAYLKVMCGLRFSFFSLQRIVFSRA